MSDYYGFTGVKAEALQRTIGLVQENEFEVTNVEKVTDDHIKLILLKTKENNNALSDIFEGKQRERHFSWDQQKSSWYIDWSYMTGG